MDFLFFYEHESREYESLLLIKKILNQRGYSVRISHVSSWGYGWHMLFSVPKVVIVPWLRSDDNVYKYTRFFRKKITKIVNLQMEQISSNYALKSGIGNIQGLAKKAYHVCWGEHSKNRLISWGICENHTHVCGAIQLDFFHPAFAGYFKSRSELAKEFNLEERRQWRMFISSFAYATYIEEKLIKLEDTYGNYYSEFALISKSGREKILNWYEEILKVEKEILFIYRPHPSEITDEKLLELERKYDNFKVISAYSIRHWIVVCDVIDTWYSTSISEVYFGKKKCNILRPEPIPYKFEVEIMNDAQIISTYKDFIKSFNDNNSEHKTFPIKEVDINRYYSYCNTSLSAERTCDYLEKVVTDQSYVNDYSLGLVGDKYHYNKMIIISLIGGFMRIFNIRLSGFIPFRKDILRNLEKANIGQRKRIRETEKKINTYIDGYLYTRRKNALINDTNRK